MLLCTQVGFRTTRIGGGHLLHNGQPLLLRGVNRHEWHERWGETTGLCSVPQQLLVASFSAY